MAITVACVPTTKAQVNTPYNSSIVATGGTAPYTYALASGSLPPGLILASTGVISGTPTTVGSSTFTITATDSTTPTAATGTTGSCGITVIAITVTCGLSSGQVNQPYNSSVTATGGTAPYTYTLASGSLPPGLTLASTGVISGTPTTAGSSGFTVKATDANSMSATTSCTIAVTGWLSRNNFLPSDYLHADDLNNLANDQRTWGGNVNGGGYTLSNVVIASSVTRVTGTVTSVFGRTGDVVANPADYTPAFIGAVPNTVQVIAGAGLSGGGPLSGNVTLSVNPAAAVVSFNTRFGAVTLTAADITSATGVVSSRQILTGTGLSGGGNLSADRTLAIVPDTVNQQVQVLVGGTLVSTRHAINLINGANVTVQAADNTASNRCDVTISSTGGSGGMVDPTTTLGDLIVRGPSVTGRLGVGTTGQVLTVDSSQTLGVKWAAPTVTAGVTSWNTRSGAVVPASGDYTVSQITNAVDSTASYTNPPWIVNIAWAKITNPPNFLVNVLTTKGDLPVQASPTTQARLPVGADGTILIADSSQTVGIRWGAAPLAPITPWTSDINAANFNLKNVKTIGTGNVTAAANNPLSVLVGSSNVGATVPSALFSDGTSQLLIGCSTTYIPTGGTGGSPWLQGFLANGTPCPIVLQPDGPAGTTEPAGVGIGQLKPAFPLDVLGDINTTGTYRVNGVALSTGGSQTPWTSDINASSHNLNSAASLNVGGSVVAGQQITVAASNPTVVLQGSTSSDIVAMQFQATSTYKWEVGVGHPLAGQFYIRDMNATAIRVQINSAGQVGINQPPSYQLDVAGDINCTGIFRVNGVALGGVTSVFGRNGAVVAATNDYTAAQITNAVDVTQTYSNPSWLTGLAWSKITGAPATGMSSFNTRTGAVVPVTGDYTVAMVTNAVATTRKLIAGAGLTATSGGDLSADRTFAVAPDTINQQVQVMSNAGLIGTRHAVNFISGANVTISVTDNSANNRVDVAIASSATGSGGMTDPTTTLGDLIVRGSAQPNRLPVGLDGQVLTAASTVALGVEWATPASSSGGQNQTPWLTDIDASTHNLDNAAQVTAVTVYTNTLELPDTSSTVTWLATIANASGVVSIERNSDNSPLLLLDGVNLQAKVPVPLSVNKTTAPAFALDVAGDCNVTGVFRVNGTPLNLNGVVTSVFTRVGAVTAQAGDYTAAQITNAVSTLASYPDPSWITSLSWAKLTGVPAYVPTTRQVLAGTGLTGGGALSADVTLSAIPLGPSGTSHSAGTAPDPGATAGATRYLREDATWAAPPSGFGDPTTTKGDLIVHGTTTTRLGVGSDGQVLTASSAQTVGVVWATPYTSPLTTKGDITVFGTATTRLPVGTDGQVLTASSAQTLGVMWAPAPAQTPWASNINGGGYTLSNAGSIGVGTSTTPQTNLEVHGVARITSNAPLPTSGPGLKLAYNLTNVRGEINAYNYTSSAYEEVIIDGIPLVLNGLSGGKVGIGNMTPAYLLDVAGDVNVTGVFRVNGTPLATSAQTPWTSNINGAGYQLTNVSLLQLQSPAANNTMEIDFYGGLASALLWSIGTDSGKNFYVNLPGVGEVVTVASGTGYVGINTGSAPLARLVVFGAQGQTITSGQYVPTAGVEAEVRLKVTTGTVGYGPALTFANSFDTFGVIRGETTNSTGNYTLGDLIFYTRPSASVSYDQEVMRIKNTGNVGIGTNAPIAALHVSMAAASNGGNGQVIWGDGAGHQGALYADASKLAVGSISALPLQFYTGNSAIQMTLSTAGFLGVGNLTPPQVLSLQTASGGCYIRFDAIAGQDTGLISYIGGAWSQEFDFQSDGSIGIYTKSSPTFALYLSPAGNVGLGTSSPTSLLHLYSSASTNVIATIQSAAAYAPFIDFVRGTQTWWLGPGLNASNDFSIYNKTTGIFNFWVGTNNEIGINTTAPWCPLTVVDLSAVAHPPSLTAGTVASFAVVDNTGVELAMSQFSNNTWWMQARAAGTAYPISLNPLGGNVCIGTSASRSATSTLTVLPSVDPTNIATANQITVCEASNTSGYELDVGFYFYTATGAWFGSLQAYSGGSTSYGALLLNPSGGNVGIHTGATQTPTASLSFGSAVIMDKIHLYGDGGTDVYGLGMSSSTINLYCGASGQRIAFGMYDGTTYTNWGGWVQAFFCIGTSTPSAQLCVYGATPLVNSSTAGNLAATVEVIDTSGSVGSGGAVMFTGGGGSWRMAAIKAYATNGGGNSMGDLVFYTRSATANAGLSEQLRLTAGGAVNVTGNMAVNSGNMSIPNGTLTVGPGYTAGAGDLGVARVGAPTTGVLYLGNSGGYFVYWDGSKMTLQCPSVYVPGTVNITGQYQVNGVPLKTGGQLAQASGAPYYSTPNTARALGTWYQNNTASAIFVSVVANLPVSTGIEGYSTTSTTSYITASETSNGNANNNIGSIFFIVPAGYYYSVWAAGSGNPVIQWWLEWN